MRIEQIQVDGFGKLTEFDTGATPLESLVVVLGPNEAGKSTLFSFLTTALYGFQPASRDRNPHVPWGADEAGGRVHLRTDDDQCVVIERKLRSTPSGKLLRGESGVDIRNQPIAAVDHVPRTVFRQVFAVTLAELAGLDEETWARIQDRVLGSMGASDLRSARDVADALEKEAGEIWRPNRRGNQRLRELRDEMRALRTRRNEAMDRDRRIRLLIEEREGVELRLDDVRRDLKRDKIVVDRVQELLPLKNQLDRVTALRQDGGARAELDGLPDDLAERVAELESELGRHAGRLAAIEEDLREPEDAISRFDDRARTLLEQRDRIDRFLSGRSTGTLDRERALGLEEQIEALALRIDGAAGHVLTSPLDSDTGDAVLGLSLDLLRDRVERLETARAAHTARTEITRAAAPGPEGASTSGWLQAVALVGVGAGLAAWGFLGGPNLAAAGGAAAVAVGVMLGLRTGRSTEVSKEPVADDTGAIDRLDEEIRTMIAGVEVRAEYMAPPAMPLVTGLERLRELIDERREATTALEALNIRISARRNDAQAVAEALGRVAPERAEDLETSLDRELREAERARDGAQQAERERARLRRTRDTVANDADRTEQALADLRDRVTALGGGVSAAALDIAQRRLEAHARADRIEDELQRIHPDLAELKARVRESEEGDESWSIGDSEVTERKVRIEEASTQVEELIGRTRELARDATHLRDMETVDAVDSELESLRETESRLVVERDRKWVLAQLVREADRRFREEHQPDLIRRASTYLHRLTNGRYERLLVDERTDTDLFQLVGPGLPRPVPLARPISTGTLEQAYLSLRLAIVDHLDNDRERLPLFIDEAFVNWDDERRDRGLEVLAEVSRERQVFAFTCHPEMAELLGSHGARILRLAR